MLVCGDDKGALWVYDLADLVTGKVSSPLTGGPPVAMLEPVKLLEWPELEDAEVRGGGRGKGGRCRGKLQVGSV